MAKKKSSKRKGTSSAGANTSGSSASASDESTAASKAESSNVDAPESKSDDTNATTDEAAADTPLHTLHIWQYQAFRDLLFVAAIVGIVGMGYALRAVTVPLLIALLLAYLFEPLIIRLCEHPKINRVKAVTGLLCSGGLLLLLALIIVMPIVIGQSSRLVAEVSDGTMRVRIDRAIEFLPEDVQANITEVLNGILPEAVRVTDEAAASTTGESASDGAEPGAADDTAAGNAGETSMAIADPAVAQRFAQQQKRIEELEDKLGGIAAGSLSADPATGKPGDLLDLASDSAKTVFSILASIVGVGLMLFLIPFYFFFFSVWYPDVKSFLGDLIPDKNKEHTLELLAKMDFVVAGFVRGRIVISFIMGVMLAIGWLFCGVPYSIPLGLVIGVFCAVPYLGGVGIPVAIGLLYFDQLALPESEQMGTLFILLWPTVVFVIVQLLEGYVLTPMIAGKATNLDPVTILVAVLAGGSVLGVYGMLLAIPLAACGKIMITDVLLPKIDLWTRGEAKDPLPFGR